MLSISEAAIYINAVTSGKNTTVKHKLLMYNSLLSILEISFLVV